MYWSQVRVLAGPPKKLMNMSTKDYNFRIKIFIFFTIFLLLEGFFYYYSHKLSNFCFNELIFTNKCKTDYSIFDRSKTGFNPYIWNENRIVEIIQTIFLFFTIIVFINIIKFTRSKISNNLFIYMLYLYLFCILYFFFEEISWGQHIFGWQTPEFFLKINKQGETNIHNVYSVFNELPRNLLLVWCSLSFIIIKIKVFKNVHLNYFIFPSYKLKFISFLIIFFFIPDFVVDKLDLGPSDPHVNKKELMMYIFFEIISFNFVRLSELQEFLFNTYIMCHAYFLIKVNSINKLSMLDDRFRTH